MLISEALWPARLGDSRTYAARPAALVSPARGLVQSAQHHLIRIEAQRFT